MTGITVERVEAKPINIIYWLCLKDSDLPTTNEIRQNPAVFIGCGVESIEIAGPENERPRVIKGPAFSDPEDCSVSDRLANDNKPQRVSYKCAFIFLLRKALCYSTAANEKSTAKHHFRKKQQLSKHYYMDIITRSLYSQKSVLL